MQVQPMHWHHHIVRALAVPLYPALSHDQRSPSMQTFGAKGDGVTDDTAAFEAAIHTIAISGTVWVPKGVYVITRVSEPEGSLVAWVSADAAAAALWLKV